MGSMQAESMKEMQDEGLISLDDALIWHLRSNHFPPIPLVMLGCAKEAIAACNEGDFKRIIRTPFLHKEYGNNVPANEIVDVLHLDAWIEEVE